MLSSAGSVLPSCFYGCFVPRVYITNTLFPSVRRCCLTYLDDICICVSVSVLCICVCEYRKQTGVGYPQLSAILECADAAHGLGGHVVGDGGCACPGDFAKAFGAGADFVMAGGTYYKIKLFYVPSIVVDINIVIFIFFMLLFFLYASVFTCALTFCYGNARHVCVPQGKRRQLGGNRGQTVQAVLWHVLCGGHEQACRYCTLLCCAVMCCFLCIVFCPSMLFARGLYTCVV
jgi:hypothetical protein